MLLNFGKTKTMTPKEKAKQLIESMAFSCKECDYEEKAKQCALIAVHEIIKNWINEAPIQYPYGKVINYWLEVKQEINNL